MQHFSVIELISAPSTWGGMEQHAYEVVKELTRRGHSVSIVSKPVDLFIRTFSDICSVYTLPLRNSVDLHSIYGLAKLIRANNVDVIHTHTSRDAWLALFATRWAGRGAVVTTRHVPLAAKPDIVHTWFYNKLAAILFVSEFVKSKFLHSNPTLSTIAEVIYPGTNEAKFANVASENIRDMLPIPADYFCFGYVGRITQYKGLDYLLEAIALVKQATTKPFKLLVVGEVSDYAPDYLDKLKVKAQALEIGDLIVWYGFTTNVPALMQALDALVLPTVIPETFGLVLCEAMACGKPIITTTTGAQPEIVVPAETGYLVPPADSSAIADAMLQLLADKAHSETLGQAGRKRMEQNFSSNAMGDKLEKLFSSFK